MSTIIQPKKASGTCAAKQPRPATVRAHVPASGPEVPVNQITVFPTPASIENFVAKLSNALFVVDTFISEQPDVDLGERAQVVMVATSPDGLEMLGKVTTQPVAKFVAFMFLAIVAGQARNAQRAAMWMAQGDALIRRIEENSPLELWVSDAAAPQVER